MSLLSVLLALVVIGIVLWAINTYGTMIDAKFRKIINVVAVVATVIWLLYIFGIWGRIDSVMVPRV